MPDSYPIAWDGTSESFAMAVANPGAEDSARVLDEVFRLASERAAQLHRVLTTRASGHVSELTVLQIQVGVDADDHRVRQERYNEHCRQLLASSRYARQHR